MKMITERLKFADVFPDKAVKVAQRLHIKKDEIPFVRKYYTAEKDKTEIKKKERAVISYISTGIKDRDGEMLMPEGVLLENYQKNPVVPFAHDYRTVPPAKNMWIKKDEKGLVAKTVFAKNQRADEYYQAYTEDVGGTGPLLNAFSVGFIPLEWENTDKKAMEKDPDLPKRIYNKWELLEYSLVPIPSCHEALTIAIEKGLISERLKKDLEIEVVKDRKDRIIELTMEDVKDKPIFEKKIKDVFVKEMSKDLKKHLDEQDEKIIHGDKEIELEIGNPEEGGIIAIGEKEVEALNKIKEVITKPETTENYIRIPISEGHDGHRIRTITISAEQGIKALYCGTCKVVKTYLFDRSCA